MSLDNLFHTTAVIRITQYIIIPIFMYVKINILIFDVIYKQTTVIFIGRTK